MQLDDHQNLCRGLNNPLHEVYRTIGKEKKCQRDGVGLEISTEIRLAKRDKSTHVPLYIVLFSASELQ